jgi:predicted permease
MTRARFITFVLTLSAEIRYAARRLRRQPGFSLAVILTVGLALAAAGTVFCVVETVMLRPLPYRVPDDLVAVGYGASGPKGFDAAVPSPVLLAWVARSHRVEHFAWFSSGRITVLQSDGEAKRYPAAFVSPGFFQTVGLAPVLAGRDLPQGPEQINSSMVLVSARLADELFGGIESAIGRTLTVNGEASAIVGITSRKLHFPGFEDPDIFAPLRLDPSSQVVRSLSVIARRQPNQPLSTVTSELREIDLASRSQYPAAMTSIVSRNPAPILVDLRHKIAGTSSGPLAAAFGAACLLLLLAMINVATLQTVRISSREHELGVRTALGASRLRLVLTVAAETLLLGAASGTLALVILVGNVATLQRGLSGYVPHANEIVIDGNVLMFLVVASLVAAGLATLISTTLVLWPSNVVTLSSTLKKRTPADRRWRQCLIAAQVGLAVTLSISAMLLFQTIVTLTGVQLGFDPANLGSVRVSALRFGISPEVRVTRLNDLMQIVGEIPGVIEVGASDLLPLEGHEFTFAVNEARQQGRSGVEAGVDVVSPNYFKVLGATLVAGRDFDDSDSSTTPVAIVNQTFARLRFGVADPIGRRIGLGGSARDADIIIVGVVADIRDGSPKEAPQAAVYRPFTQAWPQLGWHTAAIVWKPVSGSASPTIATVAKVVQAAEPGTAVYDAASINTRVKDATSAQRLGASIFGGFALSSLIVAGSGLYGLLASLFSQSRRDLGVRIALGANKRDLFLLVLSAAIGPTLIGIVGGWGLSMASSTFLREQLFGLSALDARTYLAAAVGMVVIAAIAALIPAYRAAQTDPTEVLRTA